MSCWFGLWPRGGWTLNGRLCRGRRRRRELAIHRSGLLYGTGALPSSARPGHPNRWRIVKAHRVVPQPHGLKSLVFGRRLLSLQYSL
jgi:hypothetical protein